jgi:hypothetical protein
MNQVFRVAAAISLFSVGAKTQDSLTFELSKTSSDPHTDHILKQYITNPESVISDNPYNFLYTINVSLGNPP